MKKNVIISLADAKYFDLLNELVDSIQSFKESQNSAICILDAGLTEEQRQNLSNKVDEIKSADWDIKVPEFKVRGKEWLKSQVSRAFLTRYFLLEDRNSWHDEWHSIYVSDPSISNDETLLRYYGDKGDYILPEYYPSLYLFILKYFFQLFGYVDDNGRILSLIFGVLTIPIAMFLTSTMKKGVDYIFHAAAWLRIARGRRPLRMNASSCGWSHQVADRRNRGPRSAGMQWQANRGDAIE